MEIREEISQRHDDILFADGFDSACIGVARTSVGFVACYDIDMCIEVLVNDGMDYGDALEYFDFNVAGAYIGDKTPVFMERDEMGTLNICGKEEV